jgi:hypothetical protein
MGRWIAKAIVLALWWAVRTVLQELFWRPGDARYYED